MCIILSAALLGPRIINVIWWLLAADRWASTFNGPLVPILGILFLPWTTLAYVLVAQNGLTGLGFVAVIIGVIAMTESQRRIPTQSAKHVRGRRVYGGGTRQYLPPIHKHGHRCVSFGNSKCLTGFSTSCSGSRTAATSDYRSARSCSSSPLFVPTRPRLPYPRCPGLSEA